MDNTASIVIAMTIMMLTICILVYATYRFLKFMAGQSDKVRGITSDEREKRNAQKVVDQLQIKDEFCKLKKENQLSEEH